MQLNRWRWEEDERLELINCKGLTSDSYDVEIICGNCGLSTTLIRSDFDRAETGMITCAYCQWGIAVIDHKYGEDEDA